MKIKPKDPVSQLLGTANKKEQAAQIQQLVQLANAPVLNILISYDSRTSRVNAEIVGANAPNEVVQQVLDGAKNLFNQQELARQVQLAQQEVQNEPPGKPDGFVEQYPNQGFKGDLSSYNPEMDKSDDKQDSTD